MRIALVGAGHRGRIYADYIQSTGRAQIVAVVEPNEKRRQAAAYAYGIPGDRCFEKAESFWALGKIADGAIIASMDRDHYAQAMAAIGVGYDLLLEKPISPALSECVALRDQARALGRHVTVCHVLRYTPFFTTLKHLLDERVVGRPICIRHEENIGNFHMAHSFVRGNWANQKQSSPIILQKSCHDMDILVWLTGSRCETLSSIGTLHYFTPSNAPKGSAARCADCIARETCRFDAEKCYLPIAGEWPAVVVTSDQSQDGLRTALKNGPYGRCVYRCGNDVCDDQATLMAFENGLSVTFGMSAFTNRICRTIRILCEDGEIYGNDEERRITITRFASNSAEAFTEEVIHTASPGSGHGGGDHLLVDNFLRTLAGEQTNSCSSLEESVESHLMAFAAERSRLAGGECIALKSLR